MTVAGSPGGSSASDDVEGALYGVVPLTTVRQPARELGRRATELMLAETVADGDHRHEHVVFESELVIRASTGSPHACSGLM